MSFETFQFQAKIAAGIKACGYAAPTPIQEQAIPPLLAGRDVMGLAQTGTGKTAAFVLPILERLSAGPRRKARALILAPTRELAEQILASVNELGRKTGLRGVAVYGGVSKFGQLQKIRNGAEIIVACPGRLLDHLDARAFRLDAIEMLVLDEADQMFDMGFLPPIRRILKALPTKRQNMLFSATMPGEIRHLASEVLTDPVTVQIDHQKPAATVSQALFPVTPKLKTPLLLALLRETETDSTLIFTRTKYGAKNLARRLAAAGHKAAALQGNMSQNQRRAALEGFKNGTFKVLVATDIAARGIDVARVSHVINFDMPDTAEAYTHRIGRTGRATRKGEAFSLVGREDFGLIRAIERNLGKAIERRTLASFDYEAAKGEPLPERTERGPRQQRAKGRPQGNTRPSNNRSKSRSAAGSRQDQAQPRHRRRQGRRPARLGLGLN